MGCVLIVEDDTDVRGMMELFVSLAGHEPITAQNGEEALLKMRARRPCVVLLDLHMPVMDGFQFRRLQASDPDLAKVPVLCITAAYDPPVISQTLGLPCLGKPVDLNDLSARIAEACAQAS